MVYGRPTVRNSSMGSGSPLWNFEPPPKKMGKKLASFRTRFTIFIHVRPRFLDQIHPSTHHLPGLVNVYITNWKITMLLMGKSTVSMAIFNSKLFVYQRVPRISQVPLVSVGFHWFITGWTSNGARWFVNCVDEPTDFWGGFSTGRLMIPNIYIYTYNFIHTYILLYIHIYFYIGQCVP